MKKNVKLTKLETECFPWRAFWVLNNYVPEYALVAVIDLKKWKVWPKNLLKDFPWYMCFQKLSEQKTLHKTLYFGLQYY